MTSRPSRSLAALRSRLKAPPAPARRYLKPINELCPDDEDAFRRQAATDRLLSALQREGFA